MGFRKSFDWEWFLSIDCPYDMASIACKLLMMDSFVAMVSGNLLNLHRRHKV